MIRSVTAAACAIVLSASLIGCAGTAKWYEQRCLNYGLARGSADFDACVARDRQWEEQERERALKPGGRS